MEASVFRLHTSIPSSSELLRHFLVPLYSTACTTQRGTPEKNLKQQRGLSLLVIHAYQSIIEKRLKILPFITKNN